MAQIKHVTVPDIGDFSKVDVIEVLVAVGDTVQAEDSLLTLETDKATMEIPAPFGGVVKEIKVKKGDKISKGDDIFAFEVEATGDAESPTEDAPKEKRVEEKSIESKKSADTSKPSEASNYESMPKEVSESPGSQSNINVHAGPATRRLARELGVDLSKVSGQGPKGRVLTEDVKGFVKSALTTGTTSGAESGLSVLAMPTIDFSQFGTVDIQPLNRIKRKSGQNLHRNWVTIPHVTQFDEADITELEKFRQDNKVSADALKIRLTPLAFLLKAAVCALKNFPQFNASLTPDGSELVYKQYYHIGVAVDTPQGLVVPVLRDVDKKGVFQLARELDEVSARAREGKLGAQDMQGSSFTISSLGGIGGTGFTPIINAPDVAILGVSKASIQPQYVDGAFVPRRMLPFSLSYDHRVIDGAEAARFTAFFAKQLQDIRNMLL